MGGYGTWAVTWGHDGDRRGQGVIREDSRDMTI